MIVTATSSVMNAKSGDILSASNVGELIGYGDSGTAVVLK